MSVYTKGGVGKTTSSVNVAAALAERGERVALVDLDDQMYATRWTAVDSTDTLFDAMLGRGQVEPLPSPLGFDVIPACEGLSALSMQVQASMELRTRQFFLLRDALAPLKEQYDYILLDCPGDLDDITVNALFAADAAILVLQTAYLSYSSYPDTHQKIQRLATARGRTLPIKALMGMYQQTKKLHQQVVSLVRDDLPNEQLFDTVVPFNVRLEEAASHEKSILQYATNSPGALAFRELAQEVLSWQA